MRETESIRGSPRLLFTKEEMESPELAKPIAKVEKAQKKYDSARKRLKKSADLQTDGQSSFLHDKADQMIGDRHAEQGFKDDSAASKEASSLNGSHKAAVKKKSAQAFRETAGAAGSRSSAETFRNEGTAKDSQILTGGKGADGSKPAASSRLVFEETAEKRHSKMTHPSKVVREINTEIHRVSARANEDDNVAATASLKAEEKAESALRMGNHAYHMKKQHSLNKLKTAERNLDRANVNFLQAAQNQENPTFTSNPYSRWQQKRAIRKEYAAAKAGKSTSAFTFSNSSRKAAEAVSDVKSTTGKVAEGIRKRPGRLVLIALLGGMLLLFMGGLQACTPLAQSVLESLVIGTYPATEDDVRAAEAAYANKEKELKYELEHYETLHPGYDEYIIEKDEIEHNPYVLIAIISAVFDGQDWTIDTAMPVIEKYFNLQYKVTETIETETRYRTETKSGIRTVTDPDTGATRTESYTYDASVPYTYITCKVKMENRDLSHMPVYSMSHHTMGMYALYMATHGNMEGIFAGNPHAVPLRDPYIYDIPQETLDADPQFAKLMEEANKYVGYPYVWGGASPETSFDCSGFVSYVFTTTGVCNTGRRGAKGLYSMCRTVTEDELRPGDLVFFAGTMGEGTDGITHVGLYVGNHHMIHCGSPCGYADLTEYYWRQHFFAYGRLPY